MTTSAFRWIALSVAAITLALPAAAKADDAVVQTRVIQTVEDSLIYQLLTADDDDDREEAAEKLGKIGTARSLEALDYAAQNDEEDDVRKDARKAAEKVRGRVLAGQIIEQEQPRIEVEVQRPTQRIIVQAPPRIIIEQAPPPVIIYRDPAPRRVIVLPPRHHYYYYQQRPYYHHRGHRGGLSIGFSYSH